MLAIALITFAAAWVPAIVTVPYFLQLLILGLIWVVVSQGQNLIQGFTGYVSIAQAGFMGLGAYASTLLSVEANWPVWGTILVAPAITAVFALAAGYPSLRVKGHYFAIVTLAYNMVIFIVLMTWKSFTGARQESSMCRAPPPLWSVSCSGTSLPAAAITCSCWRRRRSPV